uniref:NUC153 domain-containing protein n=1 Tax=Rhabditophanes sp. KR3021 TaxID=114890 RepID=A0AC35TUY1_9BILA
MKAKNGVKTTDRIAKYRDRDIKPKNDELFWDAKKDEETDGEEPEEMTFKGFTKRDKVDKGPKLSSKAKKALREEEASELNFEDDVLPDDMEEDGGDVENIKSNVLTNDDSDEEDVDLFAECGPAEADSDAEEDSGDEEDGEGKPSRSYPSANNGHNDKGKSSTGNFKQQMLYRKRTFDTITTDIGKQNRYIRSAKRVTNKF